MRHHQRNVFQTQDRFRSTNSSIRRIGQLLLYTNTQIEYNRFVDCICQETNSSCPGPAAGQVFGWEVFESELWYCWLLTNHCYNSSSPRTTLLRTTITPKGLEATRKSRLATRYFRV